MPEVWGTNHACLWWCSGCGAVFDTDDMQQVQPDGHLACPVCDPADPDVECVILEGVHSDGFTVNGKPCCDGKSEHPAAVAFGLTSTRRGE